MSESLNVIALVSGGKDSFYSLLHCIKHGHRIVALANLHPMRNGDGLSANVQYIDPAEEPIVNDPEERSSTDLNSFMYQTVGHEVIPLYAAATGIPLYRQSILGGSAHQERDYDHALEQVGLDSLRDETESMTSLLRQIMSCHPEANALCAGAILSTYQRTRVESVALRVGLIPLAYLWKYTVLPSPSGQIDDVQLLKDMGAAGIDARIIKIASAGLHEAHLWERVSSEDGAERVKRAMSRYGLEDGAALGEGGEFETIVLDGPHQLFKKSIHVPENGKKAFHEGGGSTWLSIHGAHVEEKELSENSTLNIREPDLLDKDFHFILNNLTESTRRIYADTNLKPRLLPNSVTVFNEGDGMLHWTVTAAPRNRHVCIETETMELVDQIRTLLASNSLLASHISNTIIVLRRMSDFPKVNVEYGKLFTRPNPPSRVTISCGRLLPCHVDISIILTVPQNPAKLHRVGLHVQSRSYWAPANIGPYSQAVESDVLSSNKPSGLKTVSVAGQIPLLPASMSVPTIFATESPMHIVLSLQHLWRIGVEMGIQVWTSAVAYVTASKHRPDIRVVVRLAAQAWILKHKRHESTEDELEGQPDAWDLKYNSQYMTFSRTEGNKKEKTLPDWSIFTLDQRNEPEKCVPPFFAVEVLELPRSSWVEWHAHLGLSGMQNNSTEMFQLASDDGRWTTWHMIVRTPSAIFLHTTLAGTVNIIGVTNLEGGRRELMQRYEVSLKDLNKDIEFENAVEPYLCYLDVSVFEMGLLDMLPPATIPCHSIWSAQGEMLELVGLWRTVLRGDV